MPLGWLEHGGKKYSLEDVENGALAEYYPKTYLNQVLSQREWTGIPSVTQLLNGTRQEYLKIMTEWGYSPDDAAWLVLGIGAHKNLENSAPEEADAELSLRTDYVTGITDLLEEKPDGTWRIVDYKTLGSYKVKMLKSQSAWHDYGMQLNMYRIMAQEQFPNRDINEMKLFVIVRDGGTFSAKKNGIEETNKFLDVPWYDDDEVKTFFKEKRDALVNAVTNKELPIKCNDRETWNGRRCNGYCPVANACKATW